MKVIHAFQSYLKGHTVIKMQGSKITQIKRPAERCALSLAYGKTNANKCQYSSIRPVLSLFKEFIYLFICLFIYLLFSESGERREKEREGDIDV